MGYQLFVFDLDFTLWNCGETWCDCTEPPYKQNGLDVLDQNGLKLFIYPGVKEILRTIKERGLKMAIASRSGAPSWARQLMKMFDIEQFFDYVEIYPGNKTNHFYRIRNDSGYQFNEMIFFDDEYRNIKEAKNLGIESIHVEDGVKSSIIQPYLTNPTNPARS